MTAVAALPFCDRLWVEFPNHRPIAVRCTTVRVRGRSFCWVRVDTADGGLEPGYYLLRRSASDGWIWSVCPDHAASRERWRGREPTLVGEVAISDTAAEAELGYQATLRSLEELRRSQDDPER